MVTDLEKELREGLNEGQAKAFDEILEFFAVPTEDAFVLKGYAGTGKTFLVKRIVDYLTGTYPNRRIAITAPTNKAVRVLQASGAFADKKNQGEVLGDLFSNSDRISYSTIHKLLGLKEQITASGQQLFAADGQNKNDITKFKYLIVDEVSMLADELCVEILKYSSDVRILFMGDPAQIPPVNRFDCIPFRDDHNYMFLHAELNEIMRQKGEHPVVDASFLIRNNLSESQPIPVVKTKVNEDGNGLIYLNSEEDRGEVRPILDKYFNCEEFKKDANHAKVIAWRNKTVNYMNRVIRELMYGTEAEAYVVGEKLIAHKPIFSKEKNKWGWGWVIQFNTSEEMEIEAVTVKEITFHQDVFVLKAKVYQCDVRAYDASSKSYFNAFINIIHEDSEEEYDKILSKAKAAAIAARTKQQWRAYYDIMKWSANVAYNYAITAHKAQGSTYGNVLLLEEDLDANKTVIERNRIKYTAYSRPTDKLFILRKNYGNSRQNH